MSTLTPAEQNELLTYEDARLTALLDVYRGAHDPISAGTGLAEAIGRLPRFDLMRFLLTAVVRLGDDLAETRQAADIEITATPDDAFPTYSAEQIEALDRLASVMHGPHWRIDLWTPAGVLHAIPATTKETDQ